LHRLKIKSYEYFSITDCFPCGRDWCLGRNSTHHHSLWTEERRGEVVMSTYETELGYIVKETIDGLDVTEDGEFVCELYGKTLDSYRDENDDIDDDKLESDIKETIEVADFLANEC
jgi:hypothetical protein